MEANLIVGTCRIVNDGSLLEGKVLKWENATRQLWNKLDRRWMNRVVVGGPSYYPLMRQLIKFTLLSHYPSLSLETHRCRGRRRALASLNTHTHTVTHTRRHTCTHTHARTHARAHTHTHSTYHYVPCILSVTCCKHVVLFLLCIM